MGKQAQRGRATLLTSHRRSSAKPGNERRATGPAFIGQPQVLRGSLSKADWCPRAAPLTGGPGDSLSSWLCLPFWEVTGQNPGPEALCPLSHLDEGPLKPSTY